MSKFCSKCGSQLNGNFCSNCGAKVEENSVSGLSEAANEYINKKIESKQNRNGYRTTVGIIMIILGALVFIASFDDATILTYEALGYDMTLGFTLAGIASLVGGILSIVSKNNNSLLLISGICYAIAAISNVCGIKDISILFILCCVFAPINFTIYSRTNN